MSAAVRRIIYHAAIAYNCIVAGGKEKVFEQVGSAT
jgi:hypothetical protein